MSQKYQHSGRFTITGIVLGLIGGVLLGFVAASVYAWGLPLIPVTQLACMATMAYGALVGAATVWLMMLGKVRNAKVAALVAAVVATVSLYYSWAFWVHNAIGSVAHTEAASLMLMQQPAALWDLVKIINQHGTWGMSHHSPGENYDLWVAGEEFLGAPQPKVVSNASILPSSIAFNTDPQSCA